MKENNRQLCLADHFIKCALIKYFFSYFEFLISYHPFIDCLIILKNGQKNPADTTSKMAAIHGYINKTN